MAFSVFFLAEYANMILIAFDGGHVLRRLAFTLHGWGWVEAMEPSLWKSFWDSGIHWLVFKTAFFLFSFSGSERHFRDIATTRSCALMEGVYSRDHRLDFGRGPFDS